jgi:hypothetical protein
MQPGFILIDTHHAGVEYGRSFERMDALPVTSNGAAIEPHTVWPAFEEPMIECLGDGTPLAPASESEWPARGLVVAASALPVLGRAEAATVTAVVVGMETNET